LFYTFGKSLKSANIRVDNQLYLIITKSLSDKYISNLTFNLKTLVILGSHATY